MWPYWQDQITLGASSVAIDPVLRKLSTVAEAEKLLERYCNEMKELQARKASYVELQTCSRNCLGAEFTLRYAKHAASGKPYPLVKSEFPHRGAGTTDRRLLARGTTRRDIRTVYTRH